MSFLDEIIKENQKLVAKQQVEAAEESKEVEWWLSDWYLNGQNKEGEDRCGYKCQLCEHIESFPDRESHKRHMKEAHGAYTYFGDLTLD